MRVDTEIWLQKVLWSGAVGSLVLILGHGFAFGFSLVSVLVIGLAGFLLGLIAAPEFEPRAFRYPALWQSSFGALSGFLASWAFPFSGAALAAWTMAGLLLGLLAPHWLKHIPGV